MEFLLFVSQLITYLPLMFAQNILSLSSHIAEFPGNRLVKTYKEEIVHVADK